MKRLALVLALVACEGGGSSHAPAATKPVGVVPPLPTGAFGWWRVADVPGADDIRGGAMKLATDSLAAVDAKGRGMVRDCKTAISGATVTITGCGPTLSGTVKGDTIEFEHFTMTRITGAEAQKLDEIAVASGEACRRARECYRYAYAQLGLELNEELDFGPGPAVDTCWNMFHDLGGMLTDKQKPLGPCKPPSRDP